VPILVGDCIVQTRAEAPDPCQTLGVPTTLAGADVGGGNLPATTYQLVATATNPWGETTAGGEVAVVVAASGKITGTVILPPSSTGGRVYLGTGVGAEDRYYPLTLSTLANGRIQGALTISDLGGTPATPTQKNTAYLPDTDGAEIGAFQMYKWLRDALTLLGEQAGGIEDVVGVPGTAQQQYATIPGRWIRFNSCLWDAWPVAMGRRNDIFYRYNVSGVVYVIATEVRSTKIIISSTPQPNATGGTAVLTAPMAATDVSILGPDFSAFTANGLALIDSEYMLFGQPNKVGASGSLIGIQRGVSGSKAVTHLMGATVFELKLRLGGFRYPNLVDVGQASEELDAVPAWEVPLRLFLLSEFRAHEQDIEEAQKLRAEFNALCAELKKKQADPIRSMQLGSFPDMYGGRFGRHGVIVP